MALFASASCKYLQATFAMTTYEADPKREVFGDAGDQTEEFSDENKSIVWFLVKQVQHTTKKITQGNTQALLMALVTYLWSFVEYVLSKVNKTIYGLEITPMSV